MVTVTAAAQQPPSAIPYEQLPQRRLFTVEELRRMDDAGVFGEDERVELLNGEVVLAATPGDLHIGCVNCCMAVLNAALAGRALVSVQNPLRISEQTLVMPDIAVLRLRSDYYSNSTAGPGDTYLLIEAALGSLSTDHGRKLRIYARAGITEYWIIDIEARRVEVYREPAGDEYLQRTTLTLDGMLSISAFPDVQLAVRDLLAFLGESVNDGESSDQSVEST